MTAIERPGSTDRRAFLVFGAAAGLGLAGCSAGHRPAPSSHQTPPPPPPEPTPSPGTVAAAARENDLAAVATAALDRFGKDLTTADRNLLARLRDAHLVHAAALEQQDPTRDRPVGGPSPAPTSPTNSSPTNSSPTNSSPTNSSPATPAATPPAIGHSPQAARARLGKLESRASRAYAALAAAPGGPADQLGRLVLLWGSLATASAGYAAACGSAADPGAAVIGDHRANVALPDPATAIRNLLTQCYPMIFGYQTALAALSGPDADQARSSLSRYRELRDELAERLTEQKLPVPAPMPAYRFPIQPTNAAAAARLINRMETRMLPYLGQWLATTTPDDRQHALQTMITTAGNRLTWSARLIVWPGYPPA